jgi:hypothetical protein
MEIEPFNLRGKVIKDAYTTGNPLHGETSKLILETECGRRITVKLVIAEDELTDYPTSEIEILDEAL